MTAGFKLIFGIHYFACGWVFISFTKEEAGLPTIRFSNSDSIFSVYFESIYLVTSTISTVGYGDYKGFPDNTGSWLIEQTYLLSLILFGYILFTLITNEIFTYRKLLTVRQLLHQ